MYKNESAEVHPQPSQVQRRIRFFADWGIDRHRGRRLLAEFIGTFGLVFVLSGGAAILTKYGGLVLSPLHYALILSSISACWIIGAIYCLGDISAHFNPAVTFAFWLRGQIDWRMASAYCVVQYFGAAMAACVVAALFGYGGNLGAVMSPDGYVWTIVLFEAILTTGLLLVVLSMADGPKLNCNFVPLAVGAYVMCAGVMGGAFSGAAFNPARAFGPAFALGSLSSHWLYVLGSLLGAGVAVSLAHYLRDQHSTSL
jgi:glycerol uptake facilitator-like aquaporin